MNSRLALGTVQFGLSYGVANRSAPITQEDAEAILDCAWTAGINTLDTAAVYGDCEQRLGEAGVARWQIVTKLPALPPSCPDVRAWVRECVDRSLRRLRITKLYGLLVHQADDLRGAQGEALYEGLLGLKAEEKVRKVGVSIYEPAQLEAIWQRRQPDLVQAPFNILDRRIVTSGWLERLRGAGTEIHVRSVFLQGLLLMAEEDRPAFFSRWEPLWQQWHGWLRREQLTPLQACLRFALTQGVVDRVLVGVDSLEQLQATVGSIEGAAVNPPNALASDDADLLNPSRWSLS